MKRYIQQEIIQDLSEKMVFLWWPRQVWKTTLSKIIGDGIWKFSYLNRDNIDHRKRILSAEYDTNSILIVFDELHKYHKWKTFVKGEYDVKKDTYFFLITWSARLNVFKTWGDSLMGRYRYYRLHPYSYAELDAYHSQWASIQRLLEYGWFPESYEKATKRHHLRWKRDRKMRLVTEDIRDLTDIKHISHLELLVSVLEEKVWSQFSIKSLVQDIGVTHKTISHWVDVLEYTYYLRRVYPYQSTRIKSLRKEPRVFLRDRSEVTDIWARLENMVWSHLLKWVHWKQDVTWEERDLQYLRDREWREVDFALTLDWSLHTMIEVKKNDTTISKHLKYFQKKFPDVQVVQVVYDLDEWFDRMRDGVRIVTMKTYLGELV